MRSLIGKKMLEKKGRTAQQNTQKTATYNYGLKRMCITEADCKDFLTFKKSLKSNYRRLALKHHPDVGRVDNTKGRYFKDLAVQYKILSKMKVVPATIANINRVMEIEKGYKSLDDVWWGAQFH